MKRLLLFCLLAIAVAGCKSASFYEPKFEIGMSETNFKQSNPKAELVSSGQDGLKIYRTITASWRPVPEPYSFFYFDKEKLTQFVKSDRLDDYKFIVQ